MITEEIVEELAKTVWGLWEDRYESHRQEARREARLYLQAIQAQPELAGFKTMTMTQLNNLMVQAGETQFPVAFQPEVPILIVPDPQLPEPTLPSVLGRIMYESVKPCL